MSRKPNAILAPLGSLLIAACALAAGPSVAVKSDFNAGTGTPITNPVYVAGNGQTKPGIVTTAAGIRMVGTDTTVANQTFAWAPSSPVTLQAGNVWYIKIGTAGDLAFPGAEGYLWRRWASVEVSPNVGDAANGPPGYNTTNPNAYAPGTALFGVGGQIGQQIDFWNPGGTGGDAVNSSTQGVLTTDPRVANYSVTSITPPATATAAALNGINRASLVWYPTQISAAHNGMVFTGAGPLGSMSQYRVDYGNVTVPNTVGTVDLQIQMPTWAMSGQQVLLSQAAGGNGNLTTFAQSANLHKGIASFELGQTKTSDVNLDYVTDGSDYNIVTAGLGTSATFYQGDANGDSVADGSDYNLVLANLGTSSDTATPAARAQDAQGISIRYDATSGKLTVSVPSITSGGLNSILVYGPAALSKPVTTNSITSGDEVAWAAAGGGLWLQGYFNGKEQWIRAGGARMNNGTDLELATYAPGLTAAQLTQVEYSLKNAQGVTATYFSQVEFVGVPEPASLSLLALVGLLGLRRRAA